MLCSGEYLRLFSMWAFSSGFPKSEHQAWPMVNLWKRSMSITLKKKILFFPHQPIFILYLKAYILDWHWSVFIILETEILNQYLFLICFTFFSSKSLNTLSSIILYGLQNINPPISSNEISNLECLFIGYAAYLKYPESLPHFSPHVFLQYQYFTNPMHFTYSSPHPITETAWPPTGLKSSYVTIFSGSLFI